MWGVAAVCIVGAYLIGSIPFGLLIGQMKGVDIRKHGSGNIGATNVGRVLGKKFGLAAFALDMLKGLLPVALGGQWLHRQGAEATAATTLLWLWLAVGGACIVGHMFSVYLRFKGGKGVATSLGAILGFYPYFTWPGLVAFGIWVGLTWTTSYVSVGSMVAAGAFPILFALFAGSGEWGPARYLWPLYVFAATIGILVIYRHRGNLRRLVQGTEPKVSFGRGRTAAKKEL